MVPSRDELGCPFAMVRSGVTPPGADPGGDVDIDETDLASVADLILGAERPDWVDR